MYSDTLRDLTKWKFPMVSRSFHIKIVIENSLQPEHNFKHPKAMVPFRRKILLCKTKFGLIKFTPQHIGINVRTCSRRG